MSLTDEKKQNSKDINQETSKKYNTFSNESKLNLSSPIYVFCKSKSEINSQNENGWTPIYRSIIANNLEALYELLKLGANPNIPNNLGETPLYLSVDIDNYDALIILLQYKADCNLAKKNGNTPLHIATKRNKESFISALLRNDANPNIVNKLYSQTPTHLAIINKMDEIILNEFNNNKADIYNIKDKYDKTPFDYAKDVGDQTYINLLKKIFTNNSNNSYNNNNINKNIETWGQQTPNKIEDNMETTPVKVNYADQNNSNFISLAKNVFISFDENDPNKTNGSVIIKNVKEDNKNNMNKIYNSPSNKSESKCSENKIINTELNNKRKSNSNENKSLNFTEPKNIKTYNNKTNQSIEKSKKEEENLKNNSTETAKQINISNNSIISSNFNFSAENNYSISYNNSKNNSNSGVNPNIFRLSSVYSNNTRKNNSKSNKASNLPTKRDISEMNPLEMINQVITTSNNNSNIFSELQINSMINKHTQSDEDIKNKTIQENNSNINNIMLNDSLEYSKTNTHVITEPSNQKKKIHKSTNNDHTDNIDIENINGLNITINEYEDINKNNEDMKYNKNQAKQFNNKENIMPNYNIEKRNSNLSSNNYSLNNSKKISLINNTNQNELLTTVPNSIVGENNVVFRQKYYKNNQTQPESQKEKISKDLMVDEYQNNIESMNTYNNSYKQYPNITIKNSVVNNNKSTYSTLPNNNNLIYTSSNNAYSLYNKTNKFPSLKLSEIENENNNNSFFSKNNVNKSEEINICSPQNIPNELLIRLREWLISCDLLCYYNLLIKNEIYDMDLYIHNLKNNRINISYKDIEDLGIKKPGHIFRFLLKLQIDTGILDSQIYNLITNKFNSNVLTTIGLTASTNIIKCCGITLFKENSNGGGDSHTKKNICCMGSTSSLINYSYNDIFGFLKYKDLIEFKENFIHNGFDQIDYILIQLFSNFKFNREILNDYMHIYSENDKVKVIQKLYEEKKRIALELGLLYDDNEEQKILNSQNETIGEKKENSDTCFIF